MILTADQIAQYAAAAGPGDIGTAVAIALAESGGDTNAVGDQGTSFGLWQIHLPAHPDISQQCAVDPACAARAAYAISNGWSNFHAWSTFNSGAYQQFTGAAGSSSVQTLSSVQTATSLQGQAVVGTMVTSPWFGGSWEVTQGWGQTDYSGEPEGHGYTHWHAGVDVGLDSGTILVLPAGLGGMAKAVDNPGGYGTALVVQLDSGEDVWLGHLRQRFVQDGQQLRAGDQLAATNSTGNSTGPHLHFEVRPRGGRYGTDVDPSQLLLAGAETQLLAASGPQNPYGPLDPRHALWAAEQGLTQGATQLGKVLLNGGQVALGSVLMLSGLLVTGYGLRGRTPGQLAADVRRTVSVRRRQPRSRARRQPQVSGAEATRVRPNLQPREPASRPSAPEPGYTTMRRAGTSRSGLPRYRVSR